MNIDSNASADCDTSTLESNLEETLREENMIQDMGLSVVRGDYERATPEKIKRALEVQEEMVCEKMHKAMSPISAVSGYLELMKMLLENETDRESLERYRSKIEEGINEVGVIVEELYDAFDDTSQENKPVQATEISPNVDRRAS